MTTIHSFGSCILTLQVLSLAAYLRIVTIVDTTSTWLEPEDMQPPWENESTQPWSGFYQLLTRMLKEPGTFWSARSLFRPLMTSLAPAKVDHLYWIWYNCRRIEPHYTDEEVLLANLSIKTTYARTLIATGHTSKRFTTTELIRGSETLLDKLTILVREVDDLDGIGLRPALELGMAKLEREAATVTVPGNQINHSLRDSAKEIWLLARKNHDLVTQTDSLRIQRLGAVLGYGSAGDLPEILLDPTEDMVGNVIAMTDRILAASEVVTAPAPLLPLTEERTNSDTAARKPSEDRLSYLLNQPWLIDSYEMFLYSNTMTTPMVMLKGSVARLMLAELRGGNSEIANAKERILKASQNVQWPLHCLAGVRYIGGAQHLLAHGARPNVKDDQQQTPLSIAIAVRNVAMVNLLVEWGANIHPKDTSSWAPLSLAAEKGNVAVVKALLDHGAEINAVNVNHRVPIFIAAKTGNTALVGLLLGRNAEINKEGAAGQMPLHIAAMAGHEVVVSLLLDWGANINARDDSGWTSLAMAAWKGHEAVVKLLIHRGAEVNAKPWNERIPLLEAAEGGHEVVVQMLIEYGAAVNAVDYGRKRRTPLLAALKRGQGTVIRLLLDCGADVNLRDVDGNAALLFAAAHGDEATVKLLLNRGADVGATNKDGHTPLSKARQNGYQVVVELLLDNGAEDTGTIPSRTDQRPTLSSIRARMSARARK